MSQLDQNLARGSKETVMILIIIIIFIYPKTAFIVLYNTQYVRLPYFYSTIGRGPVTYSWVQYLVRNAGRNSIG
jgi:hypothetical protein